MLSLSYVTKHINRMPTGLVIVYHILNETSHNIKFPHCWQHCWNSCGPYCTYQVWSSSMYSFSSYNIYNILRLWHLLISIQSMHKPHIKHTQASHLHLSCLKLSDYDLTWFSPPQKTGFLYCTWTVGCKIALYKLIYRTDSHDYWELHNTTQSELAIARLQHSNNMRQY